MKISRLILIPVCMALFSCSSQVEDKKTVKTIEPAKTNDVAAASKGKPDMKALFGPDYKKGDIGHSIGIVQSIDVESNKVIIDHGTVHGTSVVAATTDFEVMEDTDISSISAGGRVEFLVKKGADDLYRLLVICDLGEEGTKCL